MHSYQILRTEELSIGYKQKKTSNILHSNINLNINTGKLVCLLGPNGTGKSTLMRTIAGLQKPLSGTCYINDEPIENKNFKDTAKLLSIVLTDKLNIGKLSVYHIVSLGRHPHTSWMGRLSSKDKDKIKWSLEQVGMLSFANRYIDELSDGEKQRVMIAKALAQDTALIMLDEPTAHLDLPNRVEVMRLLRNLAKETNKAILISTHELDLALQAADVIWLMAKDKPMRIGSPEDLVIEGCIENTFVSDSFNFDMATGNFIMTHKRKQEIHLVGEGNILFWTQRALSREGYQIVDSKHKCISIIIQDNIWKIKNENENFYCKNIEEMISLLNKINYNKKL